MDSSSPLSSAPASSTPSSPCSPLSNLSKTPSLPSSPIPHMDASKRYPSPMSSTPSGVQSPVKLGEPLHELDGRPPAKKRKITPPKERQTSYLDLTKPHGESTFEDEFHMNRLLSALHKKKKIVVIAGAGISVSAGIPDFRSSNGLFASARNQHKVKASGKHLFDASVYKHDASTQSFHTMVREMAEMTNNAAPTPFHHLLASLAQEGRLLRLYSQNIDGLDTGMEPLATNVPLNPKGPWPATIQLHGGLEKMVCTKCADLNPFNGELFTGPQAPLCKACEDLDAARTTFGGKRSHGIGRLRPRFVLYNEYNPDEEAIGNVSSADLKARPDAVIVVGTTLKVPGTRRLVKELCQVARGRKDGFTAWINIDSEPKGVDFKDCWDLVVRSKCDNVARLAALPPWDCDIGDDYLVSKEEDGEGQDRRSNTILEVSIPSSSASPPSSEPASAKFEVQVNAKPKHLEAIQGIPTPRPSPKIAATKPAKSKQSKLPFSNNPEDQKLAKASKPRARKPKQPAKPKSKVPPSNTVMQNFKATKSKSAHDDAGKKLGLPPSLSDILLAQEDPDRGNSLPPLRPERQNSADTFLYKCETSDGKLGDESSVAPSTPVMAKQQLKRETISPKSMPSGMRNLLD